MNDSAVVAAEAVAARRPRDAPWWLDIQAVGGWTLGFALVAVLGLSGGGYDAVVRGEVGIAAWWVVGTGIAFGAIGLSRIPTARAALALIAALTLWTALGLLWTESTERTVTEISRTVGYAGMFLLAVAVCARVPGRHIVAGVATGLGLVCGYAALTRLQPELFGPIVLNEIFPTAQRRLSQPVGYWNALAGIAAMTLPLLLAFATNARRLPIRAAAGAFVPVVLLVIFLTVSRGGVIAAAAGTALWLALAPARLAKLPVVVATALGSVVLCVAAERRDALQAGIDGALARTQGDELLAVSLLVMGGVGLVVYAAALADRHLRRPAPLNLGRRSAATMLALTVLLALIAFLGVNGPAWMGDRVDEFKGTAGTTATNFDNSFSRLQSVDSNGRYAYWVAARDAQREEPLTGTGPGTFEYVWARQNETLGSGFVRDAHSLWAEALAEMGLVGVMLTGGFFLFLLVAGAVRSLRARDQEDRAVLAAATGGVAAFCAIASLEWAWEMTVLGAAALTLAAVAVAGTGDPALVVRRSGERRTSPVWNAPSALQRCVTGGMALGAVLVMAIPTAGTADVRDSQSAVRAGELSRAFESAAAAAAAQPYSASAMMQKALVLERAGLLERARDSAADATRREPVNWRTWFVRSRLEARTGDVDAALRAFRRAKQLNPASPAFAP